MAIKMISAIAAILGVICAGPVMAGPTTSSQLALGQSIFVSKCALCHDNSQHMLNDNGPALFGVVGRRVGSLPDYAYSPILQAANARGDRWTPHRLEIFLREPALMYEGTGMPMHFDAAQDRKAIIAYLKTLRSR